MSRFLGCGMGLLLAATAGFGHHSPALYDLVHGTRIGGVVTRFAWENPHAFLYVDVRRENDSVEHWSVEMESAARLRRLGWTQDTVKAGDRVTVAGGRARDNSYRMRAEWVQLPDGRKLSSQILARY